MYTKVFKMLIIGAPASGKGTISSRILNNFKFEYISSGDKLRWHIKNNTELGVKAKSYTENGKLVPDDLMVQFIIDEIQKVGNRSWLLDGFPRTVNQAEALGKIQPIDLAVNLAVPFDVIINRVKGRWTHVSSGRVYNDEFNPPKVAGKDDISGETLIQRPDDKEDVVRKRLQAYEQLTLPVIKFYENLGILQTFRGRTSDEIWPRVLRCINSYVPLNKEAQVLKN